jgi:hypothetical protein
MQLAKRIPTSLKLNAAHGASPMHSAATTCRFSKLTSLGCRQILGRKEVRRRCANLTGRADVELKRERNILILRALLLVSLVLITHDELLPREPMGAKLACSIARLDAHFLPL